MPKVLDKNLEESMDEEMELDMGNNSDKAGSTSQISANANESIILAKIENSNRSSKYESSFYKTKLCEMALEDKENSNIVKNMIEMMNNGTAGELSPDMEEKIWNSFLHPNLTSTPIHADENSKSVEANPHEPINMEKQIEEEIYKGPKRNLTIAITNEEKIGEEISNGMKQLMGGLISAGENDEENYFEFSVEDFGLDDVLANIPPRDESEDFDDPDEMAFWNNAPPYESFGEDQVVPNIDLNMHGRGESSDENLEVSENDNIPGNMDDDSPIEILDNSVESNVHMDTHGDSSNHQNPGINAVPNAYDDEISELMMVDGEEIEVLVAVPPSND